MKFNPGFVIGEVVSNREVSKAFGCGIMGGMRPSTKTGTLVLISDMTKPFYKDEWKNGILHYTGMGKYGDQTLKGNNNIKLYESDGNGIELHLFEVYEKTKYTYKGIVKLADKPYQTSQQDEDKNNRKVWVFPLKQVDEKVVYKKDPEVEKANIIKDEELIDSLKDIRQIDQYDFAYRGIPKSKSEPSVINKIEVQKRSRSTAMNALKHAKFMCEIDETHPSFIRRNMNINYVEPHHLVPLEYSDQFDISLDVEENIVSLCSNCHNLLHYGKDFEPLLLKLYEERKELLSHVGIAISYEELVEMYL